MALSSILGDLAGSSGAGGFDIISGIGGILKSIQGNSAAKKAANRIGQITPAEARANSLYEALLQPNNSLVNSLADVERQRGVESLMQQIKAMQDADRRSQLKGRLPNFIDSSRRDEFADYVLSRGMNRVNADAVTNARGQVMDQANAIRGLVPAQSDRMSAAATAQNKYADYQTNQFGSGIDNIVDMIKRHQNSTYFPNTNTRVYWNS